MDCAICQRDLHSPRKTVSCSICRRSFHPVCTRIKSVENYKKMKSDLKLKWKCDKCIGKAVDTEGSGGEDGDLDGVSQVGGDDAGKIGSVILEMNKKLDKLSSLSTDMRDLKHSVAHMSEIFDTFVKDMDLMRKQIDTLNKENCELKTIVGDMQLKVDSIEQKSRDGNIEFNGVPESPNENCLDIVKKMSTRLGVDCGFSMAFRVGTIRKDKPRKILAMLDSRESRDNLIHAAKSDRSLTAKLICDQWPEERIYVNENLTSFRALLLRRTKEKAREKGFKFVWIKNSVIHVRKIEGAPMVVVRCPQDLDRI
ncbi:hypothetical protein GE061_002878 [Apolygus lucorum]|uniref:PHD-type domain-containing protein n=1 Tax=Apolygus lucorum TaxID=248454 RepID=A0A8S9X8Z5_APOLU|nr:hypothetical protein GE061_002878 [Apolygus lucorum]